MTISEVAEKYGLSADTLRYYEKIGIVPAVPRKNGIRDYDQNSCNWIELMKCLRSAGIPIETLIEYVSLFEEGEKTKEQRKALLIKEREQLIKRIDTMNQTLERLNYKIDYYEQGLNKFEEKLSK